MSKSRIPNGLGFDWDVFMKEEASPESDCNAYLRDVVNLSNKMDAERNISWKVPEGNYLIMRFGYTGTGIKVSTHSPGGGGGLAIDYMSIEATDLQYDLLPYLPVITGRIVESRDVSNRFLYDFRRTIADLIWENHYRRFQIRAHADGLGFIPNRVDRIPRRLMR